MNRVGCGRNAVWGGCEESLINSHFQSDHDAVTIAVTDSHFSFVPHSEFQESRNQWEFQSGTNEK